LSASKEPPKESQSANVLWTRAAPALFVFLWSTGFIGARLGTPFAEPFTFLALRMAIAALLLLFLCIAMNAPWPATRRNAGHIAVAGLLVHGAYLGGVFSAVAHKVPLGQVALIAGLQPILTAWLAKPLFGERVSRRQWSGMLLGFIGVALVVSGKSGREIASPAGLAFCVLALSGITAGTLYQKRFCAGMDLRSGGVIQFAVSGLLFWSLALAFEGRVVVWSAEFIFALSWLTLVLSLGAISLLYVLIRHGAAAKVASLFFLTPPVTAVMAFTLFDENLPLAALSGMAVTALGVALVVRGK
jgi:drug/metabolite transporter (DMT)-like permease